MAKRFTDTTKWAKTSFGHLDLKMKLVWIYLCDNCDFAGLWDINLKLLSFQVGADVTHDEIMSAFVKKVYQFDSKLFIKSFVEFQYGSLNPENKVHKSVITKLEKLGALKVLARGLQGAKDKDKDKDKDSSSLKSEEKLSLEDFETVYRDYPRKEGKSDGISKLKKEITNHQQLDQVRIAIANYKKRKLGDDPKFIMHFSTFVGKWKDWLDPTTGSVDGPRQRSLREAIEEEGLL